MKVNQQEKVSLGGTEIQTEEIFIKNHESINDNLIAFLISLCLLFYIFVHPHNVNPQINIKNNYLQLTLIERSHPTQKIGLQAITSISYQKIEKDFEKSLKNIKQYPYFDIYSQTYPSDAEKLKLNDKKISFFRQKSQINGLASFKHILNNYGDTNIIAQLNQLETQEDYLYNIKYELDQITHQISFCVVVYFKNYQNTYDYEALLHSIFRQKYSNFHVVFIVDVVSKQKIVHLYRFIQINQYRRIKIVKNIHQGYSKSMVRALGQYCKASEISILVSGNDQIITKNVFKIYNSVYQKKKPKIAFGNYFYINQQNNQMNLGSSSDYSDQQKEQNIFRQIIKFGPLFTFNNSLINYIDKEYLKTQFEKAYLSEYLSFNVLGLMLLELSCGKIQYINQYQYLKHQIVNLQGQRKELLREINMQPLLCFQYYSSS